MPCGADINTYFRPLNFSFLLLHPCPCCEGVYQFYLIMFQFCPLLGRYYLAPSLFAIPSFKELKLNHPAKLSKKCKVVKGEGKRIVRGLKTYRLRNSGFSGLILIFRHIDWSFHICVPDVCLTNPVRCRNKWPDFQSSLMPTTAMEVNRSCRCLSLDISHLYLGT